MKKILIILLYLPTIGFGFETPSDSSKSWNFYIDGLLEVDKNDDLAIKNITKAIVLANKDSSIFLNKAWTRHYLSIFYESRAKAYLNINQFENSINDFSFAIKLQKIDKISWELNTDNYYQRGYTYMRNEQYNLAILDFNRGFEIKTQPWHFRTRGFCYYYIKDYRNAILDFTRRIDDYGDTDIYFVRGNSYTMIGKYISAISDFSEHLKIKEDAQITYTRGCVYALLNSRNLACNDFKQACNLGYTEACKLSIELGGVCSLKEKQNKFSSSDKKSIPSLESRDNKISLPIITEENMKFIFVTIGNKKYKYLIDTGASDMIISSEMERDLIRAGYLKPSHYMEERIYQIANGETIKLKVAQLPYITIDNHLFKNIQIAIGNEYTSLLLGMSFLNRFDWKFNEKTIELIKK